MSGEFVQFGQGRLEFFYDNGRPETRAPPCAEGARMSPGLMPARPRNAVAQRFQLDQLGLHLAELASHGVEVFAHEAVALLELVLDDQLTSVPTTGQPSRAPLRNTQWYMPAASIISTNDKPRTATMSLVPLR